MMISASPTSATSATSSSTSTGWLDIIVALRPWVGLVRVGLALRHWGRFSGFRSEPYRGEGLFSFALFEDGGRTVPAGRIIGIGWEGRLIGTLPTWVPRCLALFRFGSRLGVSILWTFGP